MTIGNALTFIKRGQKEITLRKALIRTSTREECLDVLAGENLSFSSPEFEEAVSLSLFKCQKEDEAEQLKAFHMWWSLLCRSHPPLNKGNSNACADRAQI